MTSCSYWRLGRWRQCPNELRINHDCLRQVSAFGHGITYTGNRLDRQDRVEMGGTGPPFSPGGLLFNIRRPLLFLNVQVVSNASSRAGSRDHLHTPARHQREAIDWTEMISGVLHLQ